jgi:hypothetical protein
VNAVSRRSNAISLLRCAVIGLLVASAHAAELKANTAATFDHYIRATELHHAEDLSGGYFLVVDRLPDALRQETYVKLRQGQVYIQPLESREDGNSIRVPDGLIHHWVGVIFVSGATVSQVLAVLQDYDDYKNVYKPYVRDSKLLEQSKNDFKIYLQFYQKSIATVAINANFDVRYTMSGPTRALSQSHSTRIAEVANPDEQNERELPVGKDHGYLWRLNDYWRMEEKDGGTYIQLESVGLSRSIPAIFAWFINPLVRSLPRTALSKFLNATRRAVVNRYHTSGLVLPGLVVPDHRSHRILGCSDPLQSSNCADQIPTVVSDSAYANGLKLFGRLLWWPDDTNFLVF